MEKNDQDTATTAYSARPVTEWTTEDVADWARKVLNFRVTEKRLAVDKSLKILIDQAINGAALLQFDDRMDLKASLSLLDGHARILWAELKKLKSLAEPEAQPHTNDEIAILKKQIAELEYDIIKLSLGGRSSSAVTDSAKKKYYHLKLDHATT